MAMTKDDFYSSSNGDRWQLIRDTTSAGIVKLSRFRRDGVQRARLHAAAVAARHCAAASDRKIRNR